MKTYIIRDSNGVEDYYVIERDLKYFLHYSHNGQWREDLRGQLILSVEDTGNGYVWKGEKSISKYDQSTYVQILMRFMLDTDYKIYEENLTEL